MPGAIDTRTGGYGYDREIVAGLERRGWTVEVHEIPGTFPFPSADARATAAATLASIPAGARVIVDGLALGALPDEASREAARLRLVALVHHPLADETGLTPDARASLEAGERRALQAARHIVVTSARTALALDRFGVPAPSITVIEPGTEPAPQARGSNGVVVELLCVATVVPRKGHDVLVRALATMPGASWHLTCVGGLDRDGAWAASIRAQVAAAGLDRQMTFAGELDREPLDALYDRADVFVLPTWYEGYGMAVAEAIARGLPVVSTATGAIADLVGPDAGLLVPAGDAEALAGALSALVTDAALRKRLAAGARRARAALPSWDDAAERMARTIEGIDG
ncbi:MAG TPA: glycosyltransferase family 4 protein [Vicinamibacterales bacterium]|nr:glycosyltransferase family 4 protein [Vicinamibacterales bacterium]